jgi:hypothetical protein
MTKYGYEGLTEFGKKFIVEELIPALESGEYTKGTGMLRYTPDDGEPDKFCCLGVACQILSDKELIAQPKRKVGHSAWEWPTVDSMLCEVEGSLPSDAVELLGMDPLGQFKGTDYDNLANVNDQSDTFGPVIDTLRKHFTEGN